MAGVVAHVVASGDMDASLIVAAAGALAAIAAVIVAVKANQQSARAIELTTPGVGVGDVRWVLEPMGTSGRAWLLRNVGKATAEGVTIRAEDLGDVLLERDLPDGVTVRPHDGTELVFHRPVGIPRLWAVPVRWAGQQDPVPVPIPT